MNDEKITTIDQALELLQAGRISQLVCTYHINRLSKASVPVEPEPEPVAPLDKATRDAQFAEYHKLFMWVLHRECCFEDGSRSPQHDELVDDAVSHGWVAWESLCRRKPEISAKTRIGWAARDGARRAKSAASRERKLLQRNEGGADEVQDKPPVEYRDPDNREAVERMLDQIPNEYQAVCRLISYGCAIGTIAERRDTSRWTLRRSLNDLRDWILGAHPEWTELLDHHADDAAYASLFVVDTDREPRREFVPNWQTPTSIPSSTEHNRCAKLESMTYVHDVDNDITIINRTTENMLAFRDTATDEPAILADHVEHESPSMSREDYLYQYAADLYRIAIGKHGTVRALYAGA